MAARSRGGLLIYESTPMVIDLADPVTPDAKESVNQLLREARIVREEIGSGRSDTMLRLFDYLLECSSAGHAPKEIEIFHAIFAGPCHDATSQDSAVRVYIHRLRKKLSDFYAGRPGARLMIPRGEYRIILVDAAENEESQIEELEIVGPPDKAHMFRLLMLIVAGFVLLNITIWTLFASDDGKRPMPEGADTFLWRPFAQDALPTLIVTGDYYLIGKAPDGKEVTHLVRDFAINSRDDLELYLMNHPEDFGRYVDVNLSYLPTSTAAALDAILPITKFMDANKSHPSTLATISGLNPDALRKSNIVYIGFLSGLGMLREPLFQASGFSIGSSYDEMIDRASGRHYLASRGMFDGDTTPQSDFGYIASLPGPVGNRVLVIAGTRDAAVTQMAELISDPAQVEALFRRVPKGGYFEALYQVRSMGNTNLNSSLLIARPLKADGIWNGGAPHQQFPDSDPEDARLEKAIVNQPL